MARVQFLWLLGIAFNAFSYGFNPADSDLNRLKKTLNHYNLTAPSVAVNFSGKGALLGYDIGVVEQLVMHAPDAFSAPLFVGNSSGSLAAAYFSCFGLTQRTVIEARDKLMSHPPTMVNDSTKDKRIRLIRATRTEESGAQLVDFLRFFLESPDKKLCSPVFPVVLYAARGDILDRRVQGSSLFNEVLKGPSVLKNLGNREVDPITLETWALDEEGKRVRAMGKACTYFVNAPAAEILKKIPSSERLCRLREIQTGEDLLMAVLSSASEPALFYPVVEANFNQPPLGDLSLLHGELSDPFWQRHYFRGLITTNNEIVELRPYDTLGENLKSLIREEDGYSLIKQRFESCRENRLSKEEIISCLINAHMDLPADQPFYSGGFISTSAGKDLKRALPEILVLGTGRPPLNSGATKVMSNWFSADINTIWRHNRWSLDWEAYPFTASIAKIRFDSDPFLQQSPELQDKLVAVWNAINFADISHKIDEEKLTELISLRRSISYELGKITSLYCMVEAHGAAPDVKNPEGIDELLPSLERQQRAKETLHKLNISIPENLFLEHVEKFLEAPFVNRYVTQTTGWEVPKEKEED